MRHDIDLGGVLISPFVAYVVAALAIMVLLRFGFSRIRFSRYVPNPPAGRGGDLRLHPRASHRSLLSNVYRRHGSCLTMADDDLSDARPSRERAPSLARRRRWRVVRLLATVVILACACLAAALVWQFYVTAPRTRDGRVSRAGGQRSAPGLRPDRRVARVRQPERRQGRRALRDRPGGFRHFHRHRPGPSWRNREADLQVKRTQAGPARGPDHPLPPRWRRSCNMRAPPRSRRRRWLPRRRSCIRPGSTEGARKYARR